MVTEKAIKERYDATIADKPGPAEVQLRIIVTEDEESADLALAAFRRGTDFADVARSASIDATKASGGEVGFAGRGGVFADARPDVTVPGSKRRQMVQRAG